MTFDVIVQNPPYQSEYNTGNNKNTSIWDKFVSLSIELAKREGFIVSVHPSSWRRPKHYLWDKMKSLQMMYLEIHNEEDGIKTFNAATRYDWYVIKNCKNESPTNVVDEKGNKENILINNMPFLSNFAIQKINDLIAKNEEEKVCVIFDTAYHAQKEYVVSNKDDTHIFPCVYSMTKNGPIYKYSSKNNLGHFGIPKVIISCARHPYPIIDMDGEYGMCQNAFAIQVSSFEEANNIQKIINSDAFKEILLATKWNNFQIDYRMFKYFKKEFWKLI